MNIVWFSWKDAQHPQAGGAEVVKSQLARRLIADGHRVTILTAQYPGAQLQETTGEGEVIRTGGRLSVYWKTAGYYRQHLKDTTDLVIDEMNTLPFLTQLYTKAPRFLFVHQLCREIWFYQLPAVVGAIGWLVEPVYLWLQRNSKTITVSESTKRDLETYGFSPDNIAIISEGLTIEPVADLSAIKKYPQPTLLSLGSIRAMKRTLDQVKAFEHAKRSIPELRLIIAGDTHDPYAQKVLKYIDQSLYKADIEVLGRVSTEKKRSLMQRCHCILVTSVKEGWGLIVTEANSQGTPAVVYDVDGLRDSVRNGKTGIISTKNTPESLSNDVVRLLENKSQYEKLRDAAHKWSKSITFDQAYADFKKELSL